jgi:RND family efflux transporter MFP subunit
VDALVVTAPIDGVVGFGASSAGTSGSDLSGLASQLPSSVSSQLGSLAGGTGGSSTQTGLAEGSPVSAGQALLTVTDVSTLSVRADVDETDVLLVSPGVQAGVTLDAVPGATYPATVSTVDLRPTTSTGGGVAYAVRLALGPGTTTEGERAPTPRPGMSAVVDLRVRTAKDAVSVPAAAVFRDGSRDAVWVVRGKVAAKRYVRLGAQGEARVEVLEGLDVGTVVVVRGADKVTQGQRIE